MPSNRTPVKPAQRSQVSTAALDAFERMLELERKCGCGGTGCRCPICTEWQARHSILCDELHLKPWQWPATEPPGSEGYTNPEAQQRHCMLKAALRRRARVR